MRALNIAATGMLAIWIFLRMLQRRAFHRFAPYCLALGALVLTCLALNLRQPIG